MHGEKNKKIDRYDATIAKRGRHESSRNVSIVEYNVVFSSSCASIYQGLYYHGSANVEQLPKNLSKCTIDKMTGEKVSTNEEFQRLSREKGERACRVLQPVLEDVEQNEQDAELPMLYKTYNVIDSYDWQMQNLSCVLSRLAIRLPLSQILSAMCMMGR